MSPKASGSSSERPITSASEGGSTIFLFPDRGVRFAGAAKMIFATAPAGGRYPQLAVDPTHAVRSQRSAKSAEGGRSVASLTSNRSNRGWAPRGGGLQPARRAARREGREAGRS